MKKIIIFISFIFIYNFVFTQNNLVFNQTLFVQTGDQAVVPEGKTWKIEASSAGELFIDGINFPIRSETDSGNLPIWVPEGTQINSHPNAPNHYLSVLEFNIEPISSSTNSSSGLGSTLGLSFNGLIDFELNVVCSGSGGWECIAGVMQVPEGKLWQIVNVSNYSFNESGNLVDIMSGGNVFVGGTPVNNTSSTEGYFFNPGVYQVYVSSGSSSSTTIRMKILEFNL